jgi:hypothetical protein
MKPAGIQQRRHQCRGGGLAIGARHRDAGPQAHDLGQHLGTAHQRQGQATGLVELGIARLHRRGIDHHMGVPDIFRAVADRHLDPHVAQAPDIGIFRRIRALNTIAQVMHDLGNAAHADAANTDEMDGADIERDAGGDALFVF